MNFFTKTKLLIAIIVILSAIIISILGTMGYHRYTMDRRERIESRDRQPGKFIAKQLKLTPEQIKEFDSLRENFHAESSKRMKESRDISQEIMEEMMSEKPDTEKLKSLAQKFGKIQEQQKVMMINHLLEIKGKCSESQQGYFKKLLRQIENHDRNRMNRERRRNNEGRERE